MMIYSAKQHGNVAENEHTVKCKVCRLKISIDRENLTVERCSECCDLSTVHLQQTVRQFFSRVISH